MKRIALLSLLCPLISGCLLIPAHDFVCHVKRPIGDEYKAILKREQYRFPIELEYLHDGQRNIIKDAMICNNPDVFYGRTCDEFSVHWDQSFQTKSLKGHSGQLKVLELNSKSNLELSAKHCNEIIGDFTGDFIRHPDGGTQLDRVDLLPKDQAELEILPYRMTLLSPEQAKSPYGIELVRYTVDKSELRNALGDLASPPEGP